MIQEAWTYVVDAWVFRTANLALVPAKVDMTKRAQRVGVQACTVNVWMMGERWRRKMLPDSGSKRLRRLERRSNEDNG